MIKRQHSSHTIKKISISNATYLFIDGMSRSGKTSVAPIVSSLNRVEHFKERSTYDRFLMMHESGDLSKQGFKYLFESDLLMDTWFSMMGRDVNNNLHDLTGILNSPKHKAYIKRTKKKDNQNTFDEILNDIKDRKLIFPFISDDLATISGLLSEISKNFKYIIVMRNPIDMVFTWYRSGRGSRLGTDLRYTNPAFVIKRFNNIHHSMLDNAKEYYNASPLEKCFLVIEKNMKKYMDSNLIKSKNSCLVPIENYWIETENYLKKFENLLNTSRTIFTKNEIKGANLPRKRNPEMFSLKANIIFDNMRKKYVQRLKNLCRRYEDEISDIYKLNSILKFPKGKFKKMSVKEYSKISPGSKYNRGKLIKNK